jgi:hypothetical protein
MDNLKFDADESFNAALKTMGRFLEDHNEEGPMATVSLARALGGLLVLTTSEDQRDMALGTTISQLCDTFTDFLHMEMNDGKVE